MPPLWPWPCPLLRRLVLLGAVQHQRDPAPPGLRPGGSCTGGKTGEALISDLESRLERRPQCCGPASPGRSTRPGRPSRHEHVTVNGRRVDRPSYQVQPYDVVAIAERSRAKPPFQIAASGAHATSAGLPRGRALAELRCTVTRRPRREGR